MSAINNCLQKVKFHRNTNFNGYHVVPQYFPEKLKFQLSIVKLSKISVEFWTLSQYIYCRVTVSIESNNKETLRLFTSRIEYENYTKLEIASNQIDYDEMAQSTAQYLPCNPS